MKPDEKLSRGAQYIAFCCGIICLTIGIKSAWLSYGAETFVFRFKHLDAVGPVAAFELGACLLVGLVLIYSSLRHLRRGNAA